VAWWEQKAKRFFAQNLGAIEKEATLQAIRGNTRLVLCTWETNYSGQNSPYTHATFEEMVESARGTTNVYLSFYIDKSMLMFFCHLQRLLSEHFGLSVELYPPASLPKYFTKSAYMWADLGAFLSSCCLFGEQDVSVSAAPKHILDLMQQSWVASKQSIGVFKKE